MKSHGALTTLDEREIRLFPCNSLGGHPRTPSGEYRLGHVTSLCFVKGFCVVGFSARFVGKIGGNFVAGGMTGV